MNTGPASPAPPPINLREAVQRRLVQLTFVMPLRLEDFTEEACDAICESEERGNSYTQGVSLNGDVAILLDHWGWARPHDRYSFAVFERNNGTWERVRSRIEGINDAVTLAITTMMERTS